MPGWLKKTLLWSTGVVLLLVVGIAVLQTFIVNPLMEQELRDNPAGEEAAEAMLLTFPDGRTIPVNYLREGDLVFVGADGPWWREFEAGEVPVQLLIRGEPLEGLAGAVVDDPAYTKAVFARLRPTAPAWLPDWLNGVLVEIDLQHMEEPD